MSIDPMPLTRRAFAAGALSLVAAPSIAARARMRIVSLDYGLAQTVLALGLPLAGLIDTDGWPVWAIEPPLPEGVANLGSASALNMEVLVQLRPDLILSTPYLEALRPALERVAPVESLAIHDLGGSPYPQILAATRKIGRLTDREAEAEALIARAQCRFETCAADLAPLGDTPLLFVHFLDTRHLRVYGPGGNYQDVLDRLGLTNGWTRPTNGWGFATVGMEALPPEPAAQLFLMDPVPPDVAPVLARSPIWQSLPFVQCGRVYRMENALMFGTLPAMTRFARLLAAARRRL
jgi:ferric hydroxamate transport system substrate-binding protein